MKNGDLVRCLFQPSSSGYNSVDGTMIPMVHKIKDELGFYIKDAGYNSGVVLFAEFGYEHSIAHSALEVINESR